MLIQLFNLLKEFPILWYPLLNVSYNAFFIDQECYSATAVQYSNSLFLIGNQRKSYTVFFGKFFVGFYGVVTYTQNLGVQVFKTLDVFLKGQ
jgi:hypothetical protein